MHAKPLKKITIWCKVLGGKIFWENAKMSIIYRVSYSVLLLYAVILCCLFVFVFSILY